MGRQTRPLRCVTLLIALTVHPVAALAQNQVSPQPRKLPDKVLAFLKTMGHKSKERPTFTGKVIAIPENLRESLEGFGGLYLHRFVILRMRRHLGISYRESELLVVTDAKSGEVLSALWDFGWLDAPASFKELLTSYSDTYGLEGIVYRLRLLAELLVHLAKDHEREQVLVPRVGSVRPDEKRQTVEVELILKYVPRFLLKNQLKRDGAYYRFGRLSFLDLETGREN